MSTKLESGVGESGGDAGFDIGAAVESIGTDLGFDVAEPAEVEVVDAAEGGAPVVVTEAPADSAPPKEEEEAPAKAIPAPQTWRKEAAEAFAALPDVVKAEVLKREEDIHKGISQYKDDAAFAQSVKSVLQPHAELFKQSGVDPLRQVQSLLNAHVSLATQSAEQRLHTFTQLASEYGVSISDLSNLVDSTTPEVLALRQELNTLKSNLTNMTQAQLSAKQAETTALVSAFAQDPAHPYFDEVANDIAVLIERGVAGTLAEAYEKAVWMNPTIRAKETARQQEEAQAKAKEAASKKVAEAKKATAANIKSKAKSGSATTPLGSIDDTLSETMAAIMARS